MLKTSQVKGNSRNERCHCMRCIWAIRLYVLEAFKYFRRGYVIAAQHRHAVNRLNGRDYQNIYIFNGSAFANNLQGMCLNFDCNWLWYLWFFALKFRRHQFKVKKRQHNLKTIWNWYKHIYERRHFSSASKHHQFSVFIVIFWEIACQNQVSITTHFSNDELMLFNLQNRAEARLLELHLHTKILSNCLIWS